MTLSAVAQRRLDSCDARLREIVAEVAAEIPLTVVCGHRGQVEQDEAVRLGRSKTPWPTSKHNTLPSIAVDLAPIKDGAIDWNDRDLFCALGRLVLATAKAKGVKLRWGGDWDGDGKTRFDGDKDERFVDLPHFEIVGG